MPEDQSVTNVSLERLLDNMEDYSLQVQNYQSIQNALESADNISVQVIKKILLVCVCDLKDDIKCTINGLNILSTLLKKIKVMQCSPLPDLVPSAVVVLRILKTTALFNKVETLKIQCFEIMGLYPDETLISLAVDQSNELMELFNLYCHQRIPVDVRIQPICLITKFLKILPPDKKATFVKEGLNVWFSKIIPTVINCSTNQHSLEALELLTEELTNIDYADNPQWRNVLASIYTPQKYPAIMKTLLEQGSDTWHRLWMVFIKLLKTQITKNTNTVGSPINSMLPVVEMAFKMDIPNRCRAFRCWNVLIDNFATETNEVYINKRLKLLIIPLLSNNAKVEETALAKLNTWWHLISSFYSKTDSFGSSMLLTFLHFCFGKPVSDKPVIVPGMISDKTKTECVKVFINILGHVDCDGCVDYLKLNRKLVNTKLLVSHWSDWIHSLSTALRICSENEFKDEQISCVWKSFVMTMGELPENNVRRDLFNEVVGILEKLSKDFKNRHVEVIINTLIPILFENNEKIRPLLKTNTELNSPVIKIITMLLRLPLADIETRVNVNKLRNMTDYLVEDAFKTSSHTIEWLLKDLSSNNLLLWITLSESICDKKYSSCPRLLSKTILWPFKYMDMFVKNKQSTSSWLKLYKFLCPLLHMTTVSNDVLNTLLSLNFASTHNFTFDIILALSQSKFDGKQLKNTEDDKCVSEVQLLYKSTTNLRDLDLNSVLPTLLDIIVLICNNVSSMNETTVKNVVLSVANILETSHTTLEKSITNKENIIRHLKEILESMEMIFKKDAYMELQLRLKDNLENLKPFTKDDEVFNKITSVIYKNTVVSREEVKAFDNNPNTEKEGSSKDNFTAPSKVTKKEKKKEASIVNTVVENGEEYVVVKSNWKFNPRKLTDNQKEKLQRKREDIPALYQDLSQSQDEFKLATWKSDSMDTSTSKSAGVQGNEDANTILKNIPNSEFVPKMLENMISKEKNEINKEKNESKLSNEGDSNKPKDNEKDSKVVVKDAKSPRLALKDRVFRNVRNLIEKSNASENENINTTDISKTPKITKLNPVVYLSNSAPSLINADRPSRVKRTPKKFDDLQLFALKKRRYSGQSDSPSDGEITDSPIEETTEAAIDNNDLKVNVNESNDKILKIAQSKESEIPEQKTGDGNETKSDENEDKIVASKVVTEEKQAEVIEEEASKTLDTKVDATPNVSPEINIVPKSLKKTRISKKSRIEKELAIDTVEGHPFLKGHSEKRITRKAFSNSPCTRKNISLKSNRSKSPKTSPKGEKKGKGLNISIEQTQNSDDITETQDIIESSQESTVTTLSVKSTKSITKTPVVTLEKTIFPDMEKQNVSEDTQNDNDIKEDTEFSCNKTAENALVDLTEDMDTESIAISPSSENVILIEEDESQREGSDKSEIIQETQNTAVADTQSMDPNTFVEVGTLKTDEISLKINQNSTKSDINMTDASIVATPDITKTMTESVLDVQKASSFKDEEQRKKDFLNNTLEISPIKTLSPVRDKSPSPETSSDYVVVKLSSPVQINGEPFDRCESPEIFTEDKVETRDASPPREVANSSPKSSLSLKKNKPQVRSGGRAAQMLGLCIPDRQIITEKASDDDTKKSPSVNTTARRNLRILYNTTTTTTNTTNTTNTSNGDNDVSEAEKDNEGTATFLKFERSLPAVDCSPSVPILKRKLAEIADEATASPASKRKRVSFHDPPVSTTICVKKYIEPSGVRSPQNSSNKRQERQLRPLPTKSPKRLDNVFKLDSVLTKTVESFTDNSEIVGMEATEDTEISPLDETPNVEIITTSDLNDKDPICLELINCQDPILNIAAKLSSPTMKVLLVKEFEGKINTIADLARMTEVEVNRLCIKAPKVQIARKVLNDYFNNKEKIEDIISMDLTNESLVPDEILNNNEIDTDKSQDNLKDTQTNQLTECQTENNTPEKIHLEERDIIHNLCDKMDDAKMITDNLSFNALTEVVMKKINSSNRNDFLNRVINHERENTTVNNDNSDTRLSVVEDYLCNTFDSKDLILFCSNLLKKIHEKPL